MAGSEPSRTIPPASIAVTALFLALGVFAAVESARGMRALGMGAAVRFLLAAICFYAVELIGYRAVLHFFPLQEGPVVPGPGEFAYCTYMLFCVVIFYPALQVTFPLPFFFRRPIYQLLGARLGKNTHCPGAIHDPPLVEFGDDVVIGGETLFFAHAAEGDKFVLARIRVGDRATVGARATVMPGVTIGEGAIVAAGAMVTKGVQIGAKELWGGVPARFIKTLN